MVSKGWLQFGFLQLAEINKPTFFMENMCFKLAFHVRRFELRKSTVQQEEHQANQAQQAYALQQQQLNINMTAESIQRQAADVNNNMTANVSDTTTVSTTSGLLQLETKNELMFSFFRLFRKVISKNWKSSQQLFMNRRKTTDKYWSVGLRERSHRNKQQ